MKYILYHGNSTFLSLSAVKSDIAEKTKNTLVIINADNEPPKNIIDKIQNKNLFLSNRTILIKRLYRNKEKETLIENILNLLENNSDEEIFFWEDQKIRSTTKYYKFFNSKNSVKEYQSLNKRNFMSWLDAELKQNELEADINTRRTLAERTNYDPERCSNEIKKHKLNDEKNIKLKDLDILTTDTLEQDIWKLLDSINTDRRDLSLTILERLISQNNDPNYILSMLARNIKLITLIKHLRGKGKTFKEICSLLKVPPFSIYPIMDIIVNYDKTKIIYLYNKLSNLDYQIKTGKIDPLLGLTLICPHL